MVLPIVIATALQRYQPSAAEATLTQAEAERREILRAFPLDQWPALPLARYALGTGNPEAAFCHWLEYNSKALGNMGGGRADKHVIYQHKDGTWRYPSEFAEVQAAWLALRAAFVQAFAHARDNHWAEMDAIALLREKGVLVKALHIYFPSRILPITSRDHLQYFLQIFQVAQTSVRDYGRVQLNRALLQAVQQQSEFDGWSNNEIAAFLYYLKTQTPNIKPQEASAKNQALSDKPVALNTLKESRTPYSADQPSQPINQSTQQATRYYKISPGEGAWQWADCQRGGFIAIGWDELGDLRQVDRAEFERRVAALVERDPDHFSKGGMEQVWKFRQIRLGDRIVANRGKSAALGIGTVTGMYVYSGQANTHRHRLAVRWDDHIERVIDQPGWQRTLIEINAELFETLLLWPSAHESEGSDEPTGDAADDLGRMQPEYLLETCAAHTHIPHSTLSAWKTAIDRKRQAIFYGPPGTGKTYLAQALARHWVGGGNGLIETVQFHPAYAYEDFVQGIRPRTQHGVLDYALVDGAFVRFCNRARKRSGMCVMIIDEINRANLSRVFGELMLLLEYRGQSITLASGEAFNIPENVIVLGSMNTADRSIALVDHALRRRFAFIALQPNFDVLRGYQRQLSAGFKPDGLIAVLQRLNAHISDPNYALGVSYFLHPELAAHIESIWRSEIEPYLEEYFFDQPDRLEAFRWERVRTEILKANSA